MNSRPVSAKTDGTVNRNTSGDQISCAVPSLIYCRVLSFVMGARGSIDPECDRIFGDR